jgi:hypothetical protein
LIWIHDLKGFMKISHRGTIGFGQQKLRWNYCLLLKNTGFPNRLMGIYGGLTQYYFDCSYFVVNSWWIRRGPIGLQALPA